MMADLNAPLEREIRRIISVAGAMPVSEYMALCLGHPEHGYYMTRDPLGAQGDFTTAPEISQMFGELIGLWAAAAWHHMGKPEAVNLIELGPGRGTMMNDALRAAKVLPGFRNAVKLHLVEISPALQKRQRQSFEGVDVHVTWHESLNDVPDGPCIILANEFFDALPVHQAVRTDGAWHERVIAIDDNDELAFGAAREPLAHFEKFLPPQIRSAPDGSVFEWRNDAAAYEIGRRLARDRGVALIIDYGHEHSDVGDTLQAVSGHTYSDPLIGPGLADITAHVDFQALAAATDSIGARVHGPLEQGEFLRRLGIANRANALKANAAHRSEEIDAAVARLTGAGTENMGRLFKVLGLSHGDLKALPGFD